MEVVLDSSRSYIQLQKCHRLNDDSEAENEFLKGWEVEVLNVRVYSNVK